MAGSARFEVDMALNASGVAKGATDGKKALADLEAAVEGVADESQKSGNTVDSFADKVTRAAREAGKSDDEIKDALRSYGVNAKDAERAIERVGDEFDETGREGKRAGDKLEDSLRDVQRQADRTRDEVGDVGDKGFRKLGDAGEEVSGELKQNLGETFSSFRGDLEDLPQIAQDVFGGLAGSVTGLLPAFGLAAGAAGIGLLISGFQQVQEQEEERKKRVSEWAQAYIGNLELMKSGLADFASVEAIYTDDEKYSKATENAKLWGVSVSDAVNAMAGDMTALSVIEQNLAEKTEELADVNIRNAAATGEGRDRLKELDISLRDGTTAYENLKSEMQAGQDIANQYSDSLIKIVKNADSATVQVDEFGNTVYTLPDGKEVLIDAKTGRATADVSKFGKDTDGVIRRLNGRDIDLSVNATVREAENAVNRLISRNNGRTIQLNARVITPQGWDK